MAENREAAKVEARTGDGAAVARGSGRMTEPWFGIELLEPMGRLETELDRLFEGIGMPMLAPQRPGLLRRFLGRTPTNREDGPWAPRIEVSEAGGKFMIRAELPGMTKDQVKVDLTDMAVTIEGERKGEKKEDRKGYHYSECHYGGFFRRIALPEGVEPGKATAEFHDGVLEISMPGPPPPEEKPGRRLEIRGG